MSTPVPVPGDPPYLAAERERLLTFAEGSRHPLGFGWLDARGQLDPTSPVELYITCRMTHVMGLGVLLGRTGAAALAEHGVEALDGPLRDLDRGGWYPAVTDDGPVGTTKGAYGHAFVVLAASSASAAGVPGASALLDAALAVAGERFWDDAAGMVVEEWDGAWQHLDPYRGMNSNMHTVEAYLAAADVTGDRSWALRAGRIAANLVSHASANAWRIPEHYDENWRPLPDYHRDQPAHPFRPFGATVGHAFEWSRLLISVDATLRGLSEQPPPGLLGAAVALFDRAVADGWATDDADGFVYTTDWDGTPVIRARMHWVLAEAVGAAATLHRVTGEPCYLDHYRRWWDYADRYLVDRDGGSWHHELDAAGRPAVTVWPGKPDVYHAFQATLVPLLPPTPSLASSLTPGVVAELEHQADEPAPVHTTEDAMHARRLSPATRTVELTQLDQVNEVLQTPGAVRVTAADLGLDGGPSGVAPGAALTGVSFDGPPEYPYIHGHFDGRRVDLHTSALRELSRRLHLHHVWGV